MPASPTYPQYVTVSQIVGSAKPEGLWKANNPDREIDLVEGRERWQSTKTDKTRQ